MAQTTRLRYLQRSKDTTGGDTFDLGRTRRGAFVHLEASPSFGRGLDNSAQLPSCNSEVFGNSPKIEMRVAVVDETSHSFKVLPLRAVAQEGSLPASESAHLNVPSSRRQNLQQSPSGGSLGPYSQTRSLQLSASFTATDSTTKDGHSLWGLYLGDCTSSSPTKEAYSSPMNITHSTGHLSPRRVLDQLDLNRHQQASTKPFVTPLRLHNKSAETPTQTITRTSSQASSQNFSRYGSGSSQTTPRSYVHSSYHSRSMAITNTPTQPTLAPAAILSSEMKTSSRLQQSRTTGPTIAKIRGCHGSRESEAKLRRRHAIYRESDYLFPLLGQNKTSSREGPQSASESESGSSSVSCCGSPRSSRTHEPDKQRVAKLDRREAIHEASFNRKDDTPRKGILKNSSVESPKRASSTMHPSSRPSPPSYPHYARPLRLATKSSKSRILRSRGHSNLVYPGIVLELLQEVDAHIREWGQL